MNPHRKKCSDMTVFVKAKELISFTFDVTENWPKKYRYDFTARVRNTALDVLEKLIEANEIYITKPEGERIGNDSGVEVLMNNSASIFWMIKRRDLQNKASAGLIKMNCFFSEAYSKHLINAKKWERASQLISDVTKLLKAWISSDRKRFKI